MQEHNTFKKPGEKSNDTILIRLSRTQKQRLETLAEASGYKTLSDYCRTNLLNPDIHNKLNDILKLLEKNKFSSREQEKSI